MNPYSSQSFQDRLSMHGEMASYASGDAARSQILYKNLIEGLAGMLVMHFGLLYPPTVIGI